MTKQKGRRAGSRNGVYTIRRTPEEAQGLFLENMALVGYTIKKMEIPFTDDALQDGYLGLWKASLAFDDTQGKQFSSYAVPAIRGEIVRGWQNLNKFNGTDLVLSFDTLISEDGSADDANKLELYGAVADERAGNMLGNVETNELLRQLLGTEEDFVVRQRMYGESLVDINKDRGKPRGWAESKVSKAKRILKKEYERMISFG